MADTERRKVQSGTGEEDLPGWWNRSLENPLRFVMSRLQKERARIQSQIELRYSIVEAAQQRLTKSITGVGLHTNNDPAEDKVGFGWLYRKPIDSGLAMPPISTWQLATIDVFVEKAQDLLIRRSFMQYCVAFGCSLVTILALAGGVLYAINKLGPEQIIKENENWWMPLFRFLAHTIPLGLFLALVYYTASLSRAFFHEATILQNRRHSVRLGRLLLHLKVSAARSPQHLSEIIAELNVSDLERIFGWNLETSTAFKDIRPEAMTNVITGEILAKVEKLAASMASINKPV